MARDELHWWFACHPEIDVNLLMISLHALFSSVTVILIFDVTFCLQEFLRDVFQSCLFALPEDCTDERDLPLCKSKVHYNIVLSSLSFVVTHIVSYHCQAMSCTVGSHLWEVHSCEGWINLHFNCCSKTDIFILRSPTCPTTRQIPRTNSSFVV